MGKGAKHDISFKPVRSYYRNMATDDCRKAMDTAKQNFISSYITFKKMHNCSLIDAPYEDFNSFIVNVDGFYKNLMKQIRNNYIEYTPVQNVKEERQWHVMMFTLRKAYKQGKEHKVTSVLHDMTR